ncbi:MAG TPA: patatin-like phospholipase family protein [Pyrinomonadaceae bacterium]|nr:patatin-like phospholipase family protein [Pyrinomonadaceae bacterium]
MPSSLDFPFHVFQVLEEEYISLYGHLEQKTKTYLRGRQVTSGLDWNFHQGHIKDWVDFTSHLQKPNLNLPINLQRYLNEERISDWRNEDQAIASLNRILEKPSYRRQDCRHIKLRETTEKLFELFHEENGNQISTDELKRLNRFLLEDLFPEHLEKVSEIRLAAIYQRRHDKEPAALCLSGGGIRSGTFALGLIQGLARHNLLTQFDYLSTVSGGGYIGAWLTAWIQRHSGPERGLAGVTSSLTNARPESKIDPEPPALRYLRENSNFLTPQVGLMSADTWTFLAIYVRNLLLNWSVLIPLLVGVLLIPRFSVAAVLAQPSQVSIRRLVLFLGFISASWAIAYIAFSRPGLRTRLIEANPRWKERMGQRGFLKYCLVPLAIAAITLTSYWAWTPNEKIWWQFLGFGLVTSLLGLLWSSFVLRFWRRKRVATVITRRTWRESTVIAALLLLVAGGAGGLVARAAAVLVERTRVLDVASGWTTEIYVCYAVPFFMLLFMLALIIFAGISSHFLGKITEEDREWWARFSAWAFIIAIAWSVFSSLVIFGPLALLASPKILGAVGGLSGLLALLLGRSGKTPATSEQVAQGGLKAQLSSLLLPLLAVLFIAVFIAGLSLVTSKLISPVSKAVDAIIKPPVPSPNGQAEPREISTRRDIDGPAQLPPSQRADAAIPVLIGSTKIGEFSPGQTTDNQSFDKHAGDHMRAIHYPRWWLFALLMLLLLGFGLLMARVINLNLFSLHNSYRSRLIRGFLAASRDKLLRQPNPFTGFDPADNVSMHELRPALLHEIDFIDFDNFTNQFKDAAEAVRAETAQPTTASEFIYQRLSENVKAEIDEKDRDTPVSQGLRANLIEDLNRILENEEIDLTKLKEFSTVPKSTDVAQSLDAAATEEQRHEYHIHRNRRAMELTYPHFILESDYPPLRLLHVVNTTLNLVGGDNLAWQQRKAEPFTISPLHCGSYRVGYRRSKDYGGDNGISLGTAMAISGAAASSNMGYYTTSPVLSLVLTLFNVRLGWWLGNPGPAGSHSYGLKTDERPSKKIYRRMSPTLSVLPVLYEAFGLTDDRSDYIYLTDGGHFENLALYEMVLRRCKLIVVSDAAADAQYRFNDLANAVRKIRIDLGVPIEFPDVPIYHEAPNKAGEGGCYWAVGLIRYSQIDRQSDGTNAKDGVLIYIKPAVYGDEPEDVVHYKRTHPTFPNETTADQFFDEPQFESYRALGSHIMDRMCGSHSGDLSKPQFVSKVISNLVRMAPQTKEKYLDFWGDADKARDPHSQAQQKKEG